METSGNSAMLSKDSKGYKGSCSSSRTCYFCGATDQIRRFCKEWKAKKKKTKDGGSRIKQDQDKNNSNDKANLDVSNAESEEDRCLLSVVVSSSETALHVNDSAVAWYVDSGATCEVRRICSKMLTRIYQWQTGSRLLQREWVT